MEYEEKLLTSQNPDGGWPYRPGGPSWTEPTAYVVLSLRGGRLPLEQARRALRWLGAAQLPDGGWPPQASVRQSTWVTAVAALLGPGVLGKAAYQNGIAWLLRQTGADTNVWSRLQQIVTGHKPVDACPGWPWYPGTSAWVTPTSLSLLALRRALRCGEDAGIRERLEMGASYLLAHACSDGGWNHGAVRALQYDAHSYAETTGAALVALAGRESSAISRACSWAEAQFAARLPSEGGSWLRLGLAAHGQTGSNAKDGPHVPRTVPGIALAMLADAAEQGHHAFLE